MPLNPIISQQVDEILNTLELNDVERTKAIKEDLEAAIISVANVGDVKDDSKYLRIETHFKILVDRLLDFLSKSQSKGSEITIDKIALQELDARLEIFKKYQQSVSNDPVTLEDLQLEYAKVAEDFNELKIKSAANLKFLTNYSEKYKKIYDESYRLIELDIDFLKIYISNAVGESLEAELQKYLKSNGTNDTIFKTLQQIESEYLDQQIIEKARGIRDIICKKDYQLLNAFQIYYPISIEQKHAILLEPELEFTPEIIDKLILRAKDLNAVSEEKYWEKFLEKLTAKNYIDTLIRWLNIAGEKDIRDVNVTKLRTAIIMPRSQVPGIKSVRKSLVMKSGVETMLMAIILISGKEQSSEELEDTIFYNVIKDSVSKNVFIKYKAKSIAEQQKLFLEAIQWRTFVLKDQFMQVAAELLVASDLSKEQQSNIVDLIDRDANLHSSDPERVKKANNEFHSEKTKNESALKDVVEQKPKPPSAPPTIFHASKSIERPPTEIIRALHIKKASQETEEKQHSSSSSDTASIGYTTPKQPIIDHTPETPKRL